MPTLEEGSKLNKERSCTKYSMNPKLYFNPLFLTNQYNMWQKELPQPLVLWVKVL